MDSHGLDKLKNKVLRTWMDSKEKKDSKEQQILAAAPFNGGRSCKKAEQEKPKPKLEPEKPKPPRPDLAKPDQLYTPHHLLVNSSSSPITCPKSPSFPAVTTAASNGVTADDSVHEPPLQLLCS